jgi:ligand-binding sensor domain-containing protein
MKILSFSSGYLLVFLFVILVQGTGNCAALLTGKTFTAKNYTISNMLCDQRSLWGGSEELIRIDKVTGEISLYPLPKGKNGYNSAPRLAFDNTNTLLAGTTENGILRYKNSKWEQLSSFSGSNLWSITVDKEGRTWAWTGNRDIVCLEAGSWRTVVTGFSGVLTKDLSGSVWLMNLPVADSCADAWIREYRDGVLQSSVSLASVCPERDLTHSMAVDTKKNCWIGTQSKLLQVSATTIKSFSVNTAPDTKTYCTVLAVNSRDMLLIQTETYISGLFSAAKIFLYDQKRDNPFDSAVITYSGKPISIAGCADDPEGCFWIAASDGTITRIDTSGKVIPLATKNPVLPANTITSLLIDKAGNSWVATSNGIARCTDTIWTMYPAQGDTLPGKDVCALAEDSSGVIWAGFRQPLISAMVSTGISRFGDDERWHMLFHSNFTQKSIAVDQSGDQWVVAENGVYRYHELNAEKLYITPGVTWYDTSVNVIAIDSDNHPWIGTDNGVKKFENNVWIDDTVFNKLFAAVKGTSHPTAEITALGFYETTALIGTSLGLYRRAGSDYTLIDTSGGILPDPFVQSIFAETDKNVWIGTRGGLVHLNGQQHTTYTTENTPLCDNDITACAVAKNGDVWVGTHKGGLTVLKGIGLTTTVGIPLQKNTGLRTVNISCRNSSYGTRIISVRTNSSMAIGFSLVSLSGKLLRQFSTSPVQSGSADFIWDGTDRFNRSVSEGMYLGIVTGNGKIIGRTMVRW